MAAIKKDKVSKPVASVAPATDETAKTVSTSTEVGTELTDEQLFALYEARKASRGKPLLEELKTVEDRANDIRRLLKAMQVPVPQRILADIAEGDVNFTLLALYRVPNNVGMTLTNLEKVTGFTGNRLSGIRVQLESEPASIAYKVSGGRQGKTVYLTKDGLKEAEEIAASDEGKALLAEIDAKIAEAKAAAAKKG